MKRCLPLPLIVLALLATFIFVGCGAKETPPTPAVAEVSPVHESEEAQDVVEQDSDEHHETSEHESEETDKELHAAEEEMEHEAEPEEVMPTIEISSSSVLNLIPQQTFGIVYCPSLAELDDRVNMLAMDLMPTAENPEIIATILADTFGAGFESLAELREIGLDLDQDFAIFMTSLAPPDISATVHLTDSGAMKQVIEAESEGTPATEYNGVNYWNAAGGGGSFAIIDDILVFTRSPEVCESVIDTYNGTKQSIITDPTYSSFLSDVSEGKAQLAAHFNFESIAPALSMSIEEQSESIKDGLESDPAAMAAAPFFEGMFASVIDMLMQLESLSATLIVEGTDVQLAPFLKFKSDGKIQNVLKEMAPNELTRLGELPSQAFMNGAFQGKPELMVQMSMFWLKMFSQDSDPEQAKMLESLIKQSEDFYEALAEEWSFSANFGDSLFPNYLIVYGLKDEQTAKTYMEEELLKQLQTSMEFAQKMVGDVPSLSMYEGAHQGESTMHNGVEIKSYIFPNFGAVLGEMPPEAAGLMPDEWHWYYAFANGQLLMAIGSQELLTMSLDNKAGIDTGPRFSGEPSYEKLVATLGLENNLLLAISPMTMVKDLLPIVAEMSDPNTAAGMQMLSGLFMNLPENYSIGFSAKVQDDGIGAKLLLTLGDFRQLIQTLAMMQSMGQMQ